MTRLLPLLLPLLSGYHALGPTAYVALGVAAAPVLTTALQVYKPGAEKGAPAPPAPPAPPPTIVVNCPTAAAPVSTRRRHAPEPTVPPVTR